MNNAESPNQTQYSRICPPASEAIAQERLAQLEIDIARIMADLDSRTEADLGTADAYDSWKFRATRALHHRRAESHFLTRWITNAASASNRKAKETMLGEKGKHLASKVAVFLSTATAYTPLYSDANRPKSIAEAEERRLHICAVKLEYTVFLSSLRDESLTTDAPFGKYRTERNKVTRVIQRIERELVTINKFSRDLRIAAAAAAAVSPATSDPAAYLEPIRSGNPKLGEINFRLQQVKARLGMNSAKMTIWLYEVLNEHLDKTRLKPEQHLMLRLIGDYVQCTKDRLAIEVN